MNYWLYLTICIIAVASPGPAVFLALKNGAFHGFKKSVIAILGNITALLTMASLSALGLGALILTSSTLFLIIKIIGGLYLIYLGIKMFKNKTFYDKNINELQIRSNIDLFKEAFFVGISNPKAIAFYTALFPQFLNLNKPILNQFILLAGTFAFCSFIFLSFYAFLAVNARGYLQKQSIAQWFNRVVGTVFVFFGLSIATSSK